MPLLRSTDPTVSLNLAAQDILVVSAPAGSSAVLADIGAAAIMDNISGTSRAYGPYLSARTVAISCTSGAINFDVPAAGRTAAMRVSVNPLTGVSSIVSPRQRVGVVGSKCVVPSNSNTTNRQIMSRTVHMALENLSEMSVVYPNFYVSANNTGELTAAGTLTVTAGLEFPLGNLAGVFRWNGSGSVSMPGKTVSRTDFLTGLNIPAGAAFALRPYAVGTAGIVFTGEGGGNFNGCAQFGVSGVPDLSQAVGSFTDTQAGIAYRPLAILGQTSRPTIGLLGTSRVQGLNDVASDIYGGRGILERAIGKQFGTIRMAASGEQLQTILLNSGATNFALRKELIDQYCTHIASDYGINDLNSGGRSAAQLTADLQTAVTLFGKPWIHCTLSPIATSSDNFTSVLMQTVNGTVNPKRITFNASVRSGEGGHSGFLELADIVESARDSGKWKADGSTANLWTPDGTHESQYACMQIEATSHAFRPLNLLR